MAKRDPQQTAMRMLLISCSLVAMAATLEAFIDCHTSCTKCKSNDDDPEIVDVYCSMCSECRENKPRAKHRVPPDQDIHGSDDNQHGGTMGMISEALLITATEEIQLTTEDYFKKLLKSREPSFSLKELHEKNSVSPTISPSASSAHSILRSAEDITGDPDPLLPATPIARTNEVPRGLQDLLARWPSGCPTPPICDATDDEYVFVPTSPPATTTTTTTTPRPTCPPIVSCIKKRKKTGMFQNSQQNMPCVPVCASNGNGMPQGPGMPFGDNGNGQQGNNQLNNNCNNNNLITGQGNVPGSNMGNNGPGSNMGNNGPGSNMGNNGPGSNMGNNGPSSNMGHGTNSNFNNMITGNGNLNNGNGNVPNSNMGQGSGNFISGSANMGHGSGNFISGSANMGHGSGQGTGFGSSNLNTINGNGQDNFNKGYFNNGKGQMNQINQIANIGGPNAVDASNFGISAGQQQFLEGKNKNYYYLYVGLPPGLVPSGRDPLRRSQIQPNIDQSIRPNIEQSIMRPNIEQSIIRPNIEKTKEAIQVPEGNLEQLL